jgi:hypothetical protein
MFRLLVALSAVVCAIECTSAHAQGRWGKGFRTGANLSRYSSSNRSYAPSSAFGFSIGIGSYPPYGYPRVGDFNPYRFDSYVYDPYRSGNFEAPDLLQDPYFREQHRYDSQFPGRRYREPLVVRPTAPAAAYLPYRSVPAYADIDSTQRVQVNPADLAEQLRSASRRLSQNLSVRKNGHTWMEYLAPDRISLLIATGNTAELRELLTHYDGVVGNPQLRIVAEAHGFGATRILLKQYVSQSAASAKPLIDEPTVETLPIPDPIR